MTPPHTEGLKELIEKLEKATGPDRALDREIHRALGHRVYDDGYWEDTIGGQRRWTEKWKIDAPAGSPGKFSWRPVEFTSSIDAALTLVPEGYRQEFGSTFKHCREQFNAHHFYAFLIPESEWDWGFDYGNGDSEPSSLPEGTHEGRSRSTLAIAIVLSALKSRAALGEKV